MPTEEDGFSRPRMGRVDEAEGHRIEALLRRRRKGFLPLNQKRRFSGTQPSHFLSDQALDVRVRRITLRDSREGREVVVKSVNGPPKTIGAVRALVRYVARLDASDERKRGMDPVPVFDGYGREISPENMSAELANWNLFSNRENLSKKAREALARGDGRLLWEMDVRARYRNVQAWHFIFSIHVDDDPDLNAERLRAAALVIIERQFTERGHRILWAIHRDKEHDGRLHAHVVVEALSRNGDRIRCDKYGDYLYSMRVELASNLRATGLDYIATRREDRYLLRQKILAGDEPFRRNVTMGQIQSGGGELSRRVPHWWDRFGEEVLENWERAQKPKREAVVALGSTHMAKRLRKRSLEKDRVKITVPYRPIFDELANTFDDPFEALALWHEMAREGGRRKDGDTADHPSRRLAIWYLAHRPETFGRLRRDGRSLKSNKKLRRLLQQVALPPVDDSHDQRGGADHLLTKVGVRSLSRIVRDRRKVEASLLRVAQIAEDRGTPLSDCECIRRRVLDELKYVQIGSPPNIPTRRDSYERVFEDDLPLGVIKPNQASFQDNPLEIRSAYKRPLKIKKPRFDSGR